MKRLGAKCLSCQLTKLVGKGLFADLWLQLSISILLQAAAGQLTCVVVSILHEITTVRVPLRGLMFRGFSYMSKIIMKVSENS